MESELAEAKLALIKGGTGRNSVLQEIVQVCAVGVACLEQHGVKEVGRMQPIVKEPEPECRHDWERDLLKGDLQCVKCLQRSEHPWPEKTR